MHAAFLVAEVLDDPRQEYLDMNRKISKYFLKLPAIGKRRVDTVIEYHSYKENPGMRQGDIIQLMDARIRHNYKTREWWLVGGNIEHRQPPCPPSNYCIFSGRVMKDIDVTEPRDYRLTDGGLMIANCSISVVTGTKESDVIPFVAINSQDDRYKPAQLLVDMAARKGLGLTIKGSLVTEKWEDKQSGEVKHKSQILLKNFTMGPKQQVTQEIKPRAEIPAGSEPKSLWLPAQDDDNDPF